MKYQINNWLKTSAQFIFNNGFSFISFFIIFSVIFINILNLQFGIDSIYDEGFLLLKTQRQSANDMSLSPSIINLFNSNSSYTLFKLKFIKFFLQIVSICFLIYSVLKMFKNRNLLYQDFSVISVFIFIFFIPSFNIYTSIFSYNHIQQIVVFLGISFFLLTLKINKKILYLLFIGFSLFISFVNIPSSGLIYFILVLFCLIFYKENNFKKWHALLIIILGFILTLLFFEIFIYDVIKWIFNLKNNFSLISATKRGYDFNDFFNAIYEYIYHFVKLFLYYSFFAIFYLFFSKRNNMLLVLIFFSILIYSDLFFLKTLESIFLFPVIVSLIKERKNIINYSLFNKLLILLAIFSPLLLSLGTNTSLATKSLYFIPIWGVLILLLNGKNNYEFYNLKNFIILLLIVTVFNEIKWLETSKNINGNFLTSTKHSKLPKISMIGIRTEQNKYFEKVRRICNFYKISKDDYSFSFQLDAMTIFALDTKVIGPFFYPLDYLLIKDKSILKIPKFIFLNEYEYDRVSDTLSKYYTDFPENYDKYFVGSPDIAGFGYNTNRWLYCRKSK